MKPKVLFFINSIKQARCVRRVQEFIEAGYPTEIYAFDRSDDNRKLPDIDARIIGCIQNGTGYLGRIRMMRNAINALNLECDNNNTIYYLFNFDVAMAFLSLHLLDKAKYLYEVSDLAELTISNPIIRFAIVCINKRMMKGAMLNVFTSNGFRDFYKDIPLNQISVIPNRISPLCPSTGDINRSIEGKGIIKIGFVGIIRFKTTLNFAIVISECFPNIELHLYGIISKGDEDAIKIEALCEKYKNIIYHGAYENPKDLPSIYNNIDMVLSAYPPTPGVIYAEPNKLYEAIYYRCPIIVGCNTFLGRKVQELNIGYVIDAMNRDAIKLFLRNINEKEYQDKVNCCSAIPQKECININDDFFKKLQTIW